MSQPFTVLGIESSCDDTAAAVVRRQGNTRAEICASVVQGQTDLHQRYGGVVPEIAARAHAERLDYVTEDAMSAAGISLADVDAIAVTAGPGLIGGLMAGVAFAKGLAAGADKPILGINHLAGHALTARMTHGLAFPYLALLVSGGHCQFLAVKGADTFLRLGGTIDDAPGEAFDKSARLLGLGQPGGPAIEKAALCGNPKRFRFPRPLSGREGCNVSFSGLKTALLLALNRLSGGAGAADADVADLAASFQQAIRDVLVEKSEAAISIYREATGSDAPAFVVCGGVASNKAIRAGLKDLCKRCGVRFVAPGPEFCTDNAAMIAWTGIERFQLGCRDAFDLAARPRWPLDEASPALIGSGKRGPKS